MSNRFLGIIDHGAFIESAIFATESSLGVDILLLSHTGKQLDTKNTNAKGTNLVEQLLQQIILCFEENERNNATCR
jgi:hypothetical protein